MKKIRLKLTIDDVAGSPASSSFDCPIARAARRRFPDVYFISIGVAKCSIGNQRYFISKNGQKFINDNIHAENCNEERPEPVTVILTPIGNLAQRR